MEIKKKTWPQYFKKILKGDKTFDLRLADFEFRKGDTLLLREFNPKTKKYTGRTLKKKVTYVMKTKDIKFFTKKDIEKYGFQIISFKL